MPEGTSGCIEELVISPADPQCLYARTLPGGNLSSRDGGATWRTLAALPGNAYEYHLVADAKAAGVATVVTERGIFRTVDGGCSWKSAMSGLPAQSGLFWRVVAGHPKEPGVLYAKAYQTPLFRSIDGGTSWLPAGPSALDTIPCTRIAIAPSDPRRLYTASLWGVWRSNDAGRTWCAASSGLPLHWVSRLVVDPSSPLRVYAPTLGGLFASVDAGRAWTRLDAGPCCLHATNLLVDPTDPRVLYVGTLEGAFRSPNRGVSWELCGATTGPQRLMAIAVDPAEPGVLYGAGERGRQFRSPDGGRSWVPPARGLPIGTAVRMRGLTGAPFALCDEKEVRAFMLKHFEPLLARLEKSGPPGSAVSLAVAPSSTRVVYLGWSAGFVFRSADSGASWTVETALRDRLGQSGHPMIWGANLRALAVHPEDEDTIYAATSERVWVSTDGARSWSAADEGVRGRKMADLVAVPTTPPVLMLATTGGGVYRALLPARGIRNRYAR